MVWPGIKREKPVENWTEFVTWILYVSIPYKIKLSTLDEKTLGK